MEAGTGWITRVTGSLFTEANKNIKTICQRQQLLKDKQKGGSESITNSQIL